MSNDLMSDWQVQHFRLTAFPDPTPFSSDVSWWKEVFGEEPEQKISKPRENVQIEEGLYGPGSIRLERNPIRIDWRLRPIVKEDDLSISNPVLGLYDEIKETFLEPMNKWFEIETVPNMKRIAFGIELLRKADNKQEGYKLLDEYLPDVKVDSVGSSDFNYRINRPRPTSIGIENLHINRLSIWSVQVFRSGHLLGLPDQVFVSEKQKQFAIRLIMDINTSQDYDGNFTHKQLSEIFSELVKLGEEISREGDIP